MAKQKPRCANGCDAPAESLRFCICRACIGKITRNLEEAVEYGKRKRALKAGGK
ncbi:MAG: hypothetical protein QG571_1298 [Pseudomonadota bacterium]|nr:hypothetical protein [Pseudomonadota bacterium]